MEKIRKNFGFGCMRLPMIGEDVDMEQTKQMVDCFLEQGFNYFDTAHGYLQGKSELALKECLTSRYPREDYVLTDKLSGSYFKKEEDIRPFFESQLAACGVDYFDFYLMHSQSTTNYQHYRDCRAYETAFALKAEGKVRHVGISFHDRAAVLEQILTDYPAIEVVQIQFNYLDYDDVAVQSRKCYEVCRRHGKPVLVMEPVKGGSLVNLPDDAKAVLDALHGGSPASYAIRFAAGFPGMLMVLSGMSSMEQMQDNLSYMKDFTPLNDAERTAVSKVVEIFRKRRDYVYQRLIDMGLTVEKPEGAFYMFVDIRKFGMDSNTFCTRMLKEGLVGVIPGIHFGTEGFMRLSYCYSDADLKEGLDRIEKFIKSL